jgi:hypothetical protein
MTLLADVAGLPVLSAGGVTYPWSDVFLAAQMWGEWAPVAERAAAPEAAPDAAALKRAGAAFRTERRLLAADELRDWLARHRLTLEDWNAYLRRRLGGGSGSGSGAAHSDEGAVWAEGVCSGAFAGFSRALAERAAALAAGEHAPGEQAPTAEPPPHADWLARMPGRAEAAELGIPPDEVASRCADLWRAESAYERLRAAVTASDEPRRALAAHSADWLRVDCEYVLAGGEDVAREAALLVREDGLPLEEVARAAGLDAVDARVYVGDMPAELRAAATSAAPGDGIGPVAVEGGSRFMVMAVRGKVAPSMDDPEIRARAHGAALERALEREVTERVTWHERY